jgi:hypothetical protein
MTSGAGVQTLRSNRAQKPSGEGLRTPRPRHPLLLSLILLLA